jgi:hypothetical protein
MNSSLEERKHKYVEAVQIDYLPPEKTFWQPTPPSYHSTNNEALNYDKPINTEEPLIIKKTKKEWMIGLVMLIVAALLLYLLGEDQFGFAQFLFAVLLLIFVLPRLLDNKALIRISTESIWFYKEDKEIPWESVLLTIIKTIHEENPSYFFIIHYYDAGLDEFHQIELPLNAVISPAALSATIEAFRPTGISS